MRQLVISVENTFYIGIEETFYIDIENTFYIDIENTFYIGIDTHTHTHTHTHTQDFGIGPIIRHATVSHFFGLRPDMPHPPVGRMCSL